MSVNVTVAFVNQYKGQQQQLLQQHGTRLRRTCLEDTFYGEGARALDQIGALTATRLTTRHSPTPQSDTPHAARWIHPSDWVVNDYVDHQDKLRALTDPGSLYAKNHRDALGRAIDDTIIAAATGTAYVGKDGTTSEAFNTSNWEIASSSVGLTVAKLRTAKRLLQAAENDDEEEYFVILSADQVEDLLGETLISSADYNTVKPLVDGKVTSFMGFNFVRSERILSDGTNDRVLAYPKSGMLFGVWDDIEIKISERADLNYTTQIYGRGTIGATRTHRAPSVAEGKLASILCVP